MDLKSHVWRPLFVVIVLAASLLSVRQFIVPEGFGIIDKDVGYMYGYGRKGNIDEWKAFPVKYKGKETCSECHDKNVEENLSSHHRVIECENCHGPKLEHPDAPEKLPIDRSRFLCLRCHGFLPYPGNRRSEMKTIDPEKHNVDLKCVECHNPHKADFY